MTMKVLACVLAAVVVTVGGAVYYHGGSGCGGCPLSKMTSEPGDKCCSDADESAACCASPASLKTISCCDAAPCESPAPATAMAATCGGAASAAKGLK
jgi:hypothetical protein